MQIKPKLPNVAILSTLTLFGTASFWPMNGWWGINHLAYLGMPFSYLFWIIALVLLGLAIVSSSLSFERVIVRIDKLIWGDRCWTRLLIICIATILFAVFRVKTHFLGDGYTWLANFGNGEIYVHKWAEFGSIYLIRWLQTFLGEYTKETACIVFQFLSIASGAITLYNMISILGKLCRNALSRLFGLITLVFSGSMLLFFGYVEFYPMSWAVCTLFLNLSLKYIHTGKYLWIVLGTYVLSVAIHVQALYFLPSVAYLVVHKQFSSSMRRYSYWTLATLFALAGTMLIWLSISRIEFNVLFLPLFTGRPVAPDYTMLSTAHLFDLAQLLLLVYPGILVLIVIWLLQSRRFTFNATSVYLSLLSVGSLIFLLTFGAAITMARDWDIMSLTLLGPVCFILYQLKGDSRVLNGRLILSYALLYSLIAGTFILVSTGHESSEDRFYSLLNSRDRSTWVIMANYFENKGESSRASSLLKEMNQEFPDYAELDQAHRLIDSGAKNKAFNIAQKLVHSNPYNPDFIQLAAYMYFTRGQYDLAEKYYRQVIGLRPHMAYLKNKLGQVYIKQGQYDEALSILREARKQDRSLTVILESIGLVYIYQGHLDSASCMADTLFNSDLNSAGGHALAMVIAVNRGDIVIARTHFVAYRQFGENRSDYQRMCKHYSYLMDN